MHRKFVSVLVVSLVASVSVLASGRQLTTVRGELTADQSIRFQDLTAELSGSEGITGPERAAIGADGRFEFRSVLSGNYRLRILAANGETVREDFVTASQASPPLQIHLKTETANSRPGGPVSLRRLRHKPAKAARKEWNEAGKYAERGDHRAAVEHLERSVALDPEYFDAHFNLGSERVMSGDPEGALHAFDKALEIDPSSPAALVNRGMVLLHFRRVEEAEADARKSLTLMDSKPAHYVLGLSLAARGKDLAAAAEHLRQSLDRYPNAKPVLDRIQMRLQAK
jgi:tetratricopeptide (TPR) repeat protein